MAQQPKVYLDDEGNPIGASTGTYLDEQGNAVNQGPPEQGPRRALETAWEVINPVEQVKGAVGGVLGEIGAANKAREERRFFPMIGHTVAAHAPVVGPALADYPENWSREMAAGEAALERAKGQGLAGVPARAAALAHAFGAVIPVLGPTIGDITRKMETGDIAGAAGTIGGLAIAPKLYGGAVKAAGAAPGLIRTLPGAADFLQRTAGALERGAATEVTSAISPKATNQKALRLGNQAQKVAPDVVEMIREEGAPWSKEGLKEQMGGKLDDAAANLDEVADARLKALSFDTGPIIEELTRQRQQQMAPALEGSAAIPSVETIPSPARTPAKWGEPSFDRPSFAEPSLEVPARDASTQVNRPRPFGRDQPLNTTRLAVIDDAIEKVKGLGPRASYEALRRIRAHFDEQAKIVYNPATTPDYLTRRSASLGAADVTGTMREALAKFDPDTAAANGPYALWRNANQVMDATMELERSKPKVGRQIAARLAASIGGGSAAGGTGAIAGWLSGGTIETILSRAPTVQLKAARTMSRLAQAIRRGDARPINSLTAQLRQLAAGTETPRGLLPILAAQRQQPPEE